MNTRAFAVSILCSACYIASTQAALINPISQDRFVESEFGRIDATDLGSFAESVLGALQVSSISDDQILLDADVFTDDNVRDVESYFEVTFDLTEDADYTLTGFIRGTYALASATGLVRLERIAPAPETIIDISTCDCGPVGWSENLDFSGSLIAGQYQLVGNTYGLNGDPFGSSSGGQSDIDFQVIPEPATVMILMLGAVASLRRNRR